MFFQKIIKLRGQSTIEIATLIVFVLTAMVIFQKYIARGMYGRWKGIGDALGHGRQYDPNLTIECGHDRWYNTGTWYNVDCFDSVCGEASCVAATANQTTCLTCIQTTCRSSYGGVDVCNQ